MVGEQNCPNAISSHVGAYSLSIPGCLRNCCLLGLNATHVLAGIPSDEDVSQAALCRLLNSSPGVVTL